jgi:hypothetical protein
MRRLRRIWRGRSGIRGSREERMDGTAGQAGAQHAAPLTKKMRVKVMGLERLAINSSEGLN